MANVEATQTTLGEFGPDGTGSVTASLSFSNPDPYGAAFSETYYLTVPEGNYYQISISADDEASASIGGASASSHWDAKSKSIIPGYAVSPWNDIPATPGTITVEIPYSNAGGPSSLSVSITSTRTKASNVPANNPDTSRNDQTCANTCATGTCNTASNFELGSIDFSQPFGRTPFSTGFSAGTLRLKSEVPTSEVFSPKGLIYEHYLTRKVVSKDYATQSATVSADGFFENVY